MGFTIDNTNRVAITPSHFMLHANYDSAGLARRRVQVAHNGITVDGRYYKYVKKPPETGWILYENSLRDAVTLTDGTKGSSMYVIEEQYVSGKTTDLTEYTTGWLSQLALLTDQTDAPKTPKVAYVGTLGPAAGSGKFLADKRSTDVLATGVTYEAELDTVTGKLTGVNADYTDPKTGRRTQLKLPELRFQNSRLDDISRKSRLEGLLEGPAHGGGDGEGDISPFHIQHRIELNGMEGEIHGKQATYIYIVGGGPKGFLRVVLVRKDLMEDDFIINIPKPSAANP